MVLVELATEEFGNDLILANFSDFPDARVRDSGPAPARHSTREWDCNAEE